MELASLAGADLHSAAGRLLVPGPHGDDRTKILRQNAKALLNLEVEFGLLLLLRFSLVNLVGNRRAV